jgi:hypothetical protein
MPGPLDQFKQRPAPSSLDQYKRRVLSVPEEEVVEEEGPGLGSALLGAGAVGAAALAMRNPALAKTAVGKVGNALNALRYTSMLSGLAVPKSMAGNVGAAATAAIERRSVAPLREFFKPQTAKDFFAELKSGGQAGAFGQQTGRMNPFGRLMGAGDTATRSALQRAGLTDQEAARLTLQSPVSLKVGGTEMLENPVANYILPFRRTPFNQFFGGMKAMTQRPGIAAGYGAAGATMGANEDIDPRTIAMTAPLASVYALPFVLGATAARYAEKPSEAGQVIAGAAPVSEYSINSAVTDPLRPFKRPAAVSALKYLLGAK